MEHVPGHARQRPARSHVNIVATETMTREANRLRMQAAIITAPPNRYRSTPLEVSYALAGQLRVPRQDIAVTKHSSESYLAVFELPEQRDRALCKSFIEIGGGVFPIRPWRSAGGPAEMTWWYRVKVSMENVPLEAWNEEGVKLILGEACIVDRLDRRTQDRESTDILTCYVWMSDPSELPRSMDYTIFATKVGQAMEINGIRVPSTPPVGKAGAKAILIHMAGYEDWRPRSPDGSSSRTSSEYGSSAPTIVPFIWTPGVLDGRSASGRRAIPTSYRVPPAPMARRDRDRDDDHRGP
jgi:hypothetical protein